MELLNGTPQSQLAFINWLRRTNPRAYTLIMAQAGTLEGFADTISNVFNKITETVSKLAPTYIETKAQYELLKLNIARAKQGMSPVESLPDAAGRFDGNGVAREGSFGNLPSWAIPAAIGFVALLFLMRSRR